MSSINIKPDKLEQIASKLSSLAEDIKEQSANLGGIESSVEAAWKSNYTGLYLNEVNVVKRNINKLGKQTQELAVILKNTADRARRLEEENKRIFLHS